jgi:hypothetical protein
MGRNGIHATAGIATGIVFEFQQHHVADGALSERPCGRQTGDPATQDDHVVPLRSIRRRQVPISQSVAENTVWTHDPAPE